MSRVDNDLRDMFAGLALNGLLASEANPTLAATRRAVALRQDRDYTVLLALEAYAVADAMLAERGRPAALPETEQASWPEQP